MTQKIGEKRYEVEYDFFTRQDGTRSCMRIMGGFLTEAEATEWAQANTTDGKVSWNIRIW